MVASKFVPDFESAKLRQSISLEFGRIKTREVTEVTAVTVGCGLLHRDEKIITSRRRV